MRCFPPPGLWQLMASDGFLQGTKEFFQEVWEEKPRVFKNSFTSEKFAGKFDFDTVLGIADKLAADDMALAFGEDINAARYKDGVRETPNQEVRSAGLIRAGNEPQLKHGPRIATLMMFQGCRQSHAPDDVSERRHHPAVPSATAVR